MKLVDHILGKRAKTLAASHKKAAQTFVEPDAWVDTYGDYLYRYALSRLREPSAAEEVVQETFLAAIRNFQQFTGSGSQLAWLVSIMRRKILDAIRLRERRKDVEELEEYQPESQLFDDSGQWVAGNMPTVEPDNIVETKELQQIVQDCLASLPLRLADVFVLSVMEQMSTESICLELSISRSTMWVRLHRARLSIAKCVSAKWSLESYHE